MVFEEYGDRANPTVIFLHGAMAYKSFMRQRELSDLFHTVFYALPGHAADAGRDFNRETAVSDVVQLIGVLGKEKVHLVGFSLGSQLALMVLDRYPEKLESVVLVSPLIDSTVLDHLMLALSTRVVGYLSKLSLPSKLIGQMVGAEGEEFNRFRREQRVQNVEKLSTQILTGMLRSSDLKNIKNIDTRVLIAVGEKESPSFLRTAKQLGGSIRNSRLLIYEGAAHNIPYKYYERFNGDLKLFLSNG